MPEVTLRHEIACDEDTYFEKCFFDPEFNRRLYLETLKFPGYDLVDTSEDAAVRKRRVHIDPPLIGLPGPVKKVIGEKFSYTEEGTFDKKTKKYTFHVIPSSMADKTKTIGTLWCEKAGEKKIVRVARISVEVKVFMVGGLVEEKILGDLKRSYEEAAKFTNDFVKEKGY